MVVFPAQIYEAPPEYEAISPICEAVDVNSTTGRIPGSRRLTLPRCDFSYGNHKNVFSYLQYLQDTQAELTDKGKGPSSPAFVEEVKEVADPDVSFPADLHDDATEAPELQNADAASTPQETPQDVPQARGVENLDAAPVWNARDGSKSTNQEVVNHVEGKERDISSLPDVPAKILSIEYGLLHRYALARWLDKAWTVGYCLTRPDLFLASSVTEILFAVRVQHTLVSYMFVRSTDVFQADDGSDATGSLFLQTGQLHKDYMDSSGARLPTCFFGTKHSEMLILLLLQVL